MLCRLSYPGPTNGGLATANIHTRTYRPRTRGLQPPHGSSRRGVRTSAPPAAPRQALATRLGRQALKPSVPRRISVTSPCVGQVPCASVRPAARGPAVSARRRPREVDKPYRPIQCRIVVLLTSSRVAIAAAIGALVSGVAVAILAGAVVLAIVIVAGLIKRQATRYVITSERLHIRHGILSKTTQETRVQRVQNVNTEQSFFERIMQVGTVDFDTAGTDDSEFRFVGVANPEEVVRAVDRAQRAAATESRGQLTSPDAL